MDNEKIAQELNNRLIQRRYNNDYVPAADQVIFSIQGKTIGTIQNFIVFSGHYPLTLIC
jgi:hypothetical protein